MHLVADALLTARRAIALTGAGISVESGIPDFRSAGGLWDRFPPEEHATADALREDPARCWAMFRALAATCAGVAPNPAHEALAWLERVGRLEAVITQNVDGLHRRARSREVLELHGTPGVLRCDGCGARREADVAAVEGVPRCACGGVERPDVVLFGEVLAAATLHRAQDLARSCDVCLVVGTSAVVWPAASIAHLAFEHGATVVQFDLEPTELSLAGRVHHFVRGPVGETLPRLVELVKRSSAEPSPDATERATGTGGA
ncbi:MAG: NAD-dependent deacylase [Planctomycetes bacterium]|nr:NAD-dependent deacylase [Planctomycetota bacterium]